MRKIHLGSGIYTVIDDEDYESVSAFKWSASKDQNGKHRAVRRIKRGSGQYTLFLSRFIMLPKGEMVVDHINGDTLDNRRENLRICTKGQNNMNRGASVRNATGIKGVRLSGSANNPWLAEIRHMGKYIYIGQFKTAEIASNAYDQKAKEIQGGFARLNNI